MPSSGPRNPSSNEQSPAQYLSAPVLRPCSARRPPRRFPCASRPAVSGHAHYARGLLRPAVSHHQIPRGRGSAALLFIFLLTGFMGFTLGPIISAYLKFLPNGHQRPRRRLFSATGAIFVRLSAVALTTRTGLQLLRWFLLAVGVPHGIRPRTGCGLPSPCRAVARSSPPCSCCCPRADPLPDEADHSAAESRTTSWRRSRCG